MALLERELGQVAYRMAKGETGLEPRRDGLVEALDREHARLAARRRAGGSGNVR